MTTTNTIHESARLYGTDVDLYTAIGLLTGSNDVNIMQAIHNMRPAQLLTTTFQELTSIKGIGPTYANRILGAIALHKNLVRSKQEEHFTIRSPEDAANYIRGEMEDLTQEHFLALYLNTKNQIIHKRTIFIGSLNASVVSAREIFSTAVRVSANGIICAHNHPSGNPAESKEDVAATKRLVEAGKIINIDVLDHIIVGKGRYVSLKEKGYI